MARRALEPVLASLFRSAHDQGFGRLSHARASQLQAVHSPKGWRRSKRLEPIPTERRSAPGSSEIGSCTQSTSITSLLKAYSASQSHGGRSVMLTRLTPASAYGARISIASDGVPRIAPRCRKVSPAGPKTSSKWACAFGRSASVAARWKDRLTSRWISAGFTTDSLAPLVENAGEPEPIVDVEVGSIPAIGVSGDELQRAPLAEAADPDRDS